MSLDTLLKIGEIGTYLLAVAVFIIMLKADIRVLRHDMANLRVRQDALTDTLTQLTQVLTKVAVQDNRLNAIEEDIRELRHGHGYIDKSAPKRMPTG